MFEASVQGHIDSVTNAEVVNGFQVQNNIYLQFGSMSGESGLAYHGSSFEPIPGGDTITFADSPSGAPDHELEEEILPVIQAVAKCLQDRGARRKERAIAAIIKNLYEGPQRPDRAHSMP